MGIGGLTRKHTRRRLEGQLVRFVPYIGGGLIFIVLPFFLPPFYQSMMARTLIFAIFAVSLDILIGYTGLFSFGHAVFFGMAGYVVGALSMHYEIANFWVTAPCGMLGALLLAALTGPVIVRFRGLYFLLLTFALGQLLFSVAWKWAWLKSPGTEAIVGILHPDFGIAWFAWTTANFYIFVLIVFVISFFLLRRFVNSPFGRALQGIRENEARMSSLGYNTWLYKYIAYIVAGVFTGVAGVLIPHQTGFVVPQFFGVEYSFLAVLMVLLGGQGTLFGPIIGAGVLVFTELLASLITPERWPLILGSLFVVTIMFLRGGIAPHLARLWKNWYDRVWKF